MIKIFQEVPLNQVENILNSNIENRVNNLEESKLLHSDYNELINKLANELKIKCFEIDFENRELRIGSEKLKGYQLPNGYDVERDEDTFRTKVFYTFEVQSGEMSLLSIIPKKFRMSETIKAEINEKKFTIGYQTFSQDEILNDELNRQVIEWRDRIINEIKGAISDINTEINIINLGILNFLGKLLNSRIKNIQLKNNQKEKLK